MERKLNVGTGAGGKVAVARTRFDQHLNDCNVCRAGFCPVSETLWRGVVVVALQQYRDESGFQS